MVSRIQREEDEEIAAGAVACDGRSVVVGTCAGGSIRYAYPSLERVGSGAPLFAQGCEGVQLSGDDVILLGQDVADSRATPADWKKRLCLVSGSTVARDTPLGPGNWSLVKALSGDVAVVYDTTEGQGIAAVDARTGTRRWAQPQEPHRVISLGQGLLAAMDPRRVTVIDATSGAVVAAHDLPMAGAATWNCVARAGDRFVLGGSTVPGRDVLFALWQPEKDQILRSAAFPAQRFFPQGLIDYATSFEECCALDIDQVASVRVTADGAGIVAAVGGDGEFLGAHQSGCAVVFLDSADLTVWSQRLVDEGDGASALLLAPDGAAIVDCCGSVYRVELAHGAA